MPTPRPAAQTRQAAPPRPAAPAPAAAAALDSELVPLTAIRRSIAKHMVVSKQTSPHVTTVMEADLTRVVKARERLKGEFERQGIRLTFTPFFVQAIVAGLKAKPEANSSFSEEGLLVHRRIHIGMAVAIPDGLIVPVIRDADEQSLLGLARAVNDLAERGRDEEADAGRGAGRHLHADQPRHRRQPVRDARSSTSRRPASWAWARSRSAPVVISKGHPLLPDADDVHRHPPHGLPELHVRPSRPRWTGRGRFPGGGQAVPGGLFGLSPKPDGTPGP